MKTFKNIQDEVLRWMADANDDGDLRTLVKDGVKASHTRLLTQTQWDFMLWPRTETISVTASNKYYSLHPLFFSPLFFYNPTTDEYLEDVAMKGLLESEADWQDGEESEPARFSLTGVARVLNQPAAAGAVTVATTGGSESSSNSVVIRGIVDGEEREETLSSGSAWSSLSGSLSFSQILDITKVGTTWTRTITVTVGSTTILSLLSTEFGKQYRQFELLLSPTTSATILYRFYQRPRTLSRDNDIPQVPVEFEDILVYDTLLNMQGYARHTPDELGLFQTRHNELMKGLIDNYKLTRSLGARPTFVRYLPRV